MSQFRVKGRRPPLLIAAGTYLLKRKGLGEEVQLGGVELRDETENGEGSVLGYHYVINGQDGVELQLTLNGAACVL